MDALDMISGPLLFVERLYEHSRKVHQAVGLIPLLVDALLASDHERVRRLQEQMSQIKSEEDRIKNALYDQFKGIHFRAAGEYALGQYIDSLDKVAESAEEFADVLVLRMAAIPTELHADLQALAAQVVHIGGQILNLAGTLWAPEETVFAQPEAGDAREAIERTIEGTCQARRLGMEFARHLYGLEGQLDPTALLCLDQCRTALKEVTKNAERAANHLRPVIQ